MGNVEVRLTSQHHREDEPSLVQKRTYIASGSQPLVRHEHGPGHMKE